MSLQICVRRPHVTTKSALSVNCQAIAHNLGTVLQEKPAKKEVVILFAFFQKRRSRAPPGALPSGQCPPHLGNFGSIPINTQVCQILVDSGRIWAMVGKSLGDFACARPGGRTASKTRSTSPASSDEPTSFDAPLDQPLRRALSPATSLSPEGARAT